MKKEDLKLFIKIPQLKSERLILRKITDKDLNDVFEYARDEKVSKYLLWSPHVSKSYTKKYINILDIKYRRGEFYDWGLEYEGKMIGTCGFTSFSLENNSGEVGFVLNSSYWNLGIATEAVKLVLEYGFKTLNLNRIEAKFMTENLASKRVMEKCNMKFEGISRQAIFAKGKYYDIGIYSILNSEYLK